MSSSEMYWVILIAANVPVYVGVGRLVFGGLEEFWECLKYWLMPDVISIVRGEWDLDCLAEMKMLWFLVVCGVVVWGEHWVIQKW